MRKGLFFLFLFYSISFIFSQVTGEGKPVAFVPENIHDMGNILKGTKIQYSFTIKNTGTAPLKIFKAQPG
ncbi:MAG: DUF1573 domain-containing protein [Thermoanaerobaculia bacterium]